jgi:hypothetical protein
MWTGCTARSSWQPGRDSVPWERLIYQWPYSFVEFFDPLGPEMRGGIAIQLGTLFSFIGPDILLITKLKAFDQRTIRNCEVGVASTIFKSSNDQNR